MKSYLENTTLTISALEVDVVKDTQNTKSLPKSQKNGKQNAAISSVMKKFGLLSNDNIFIEFGAGKGGLSSYINAITDNDSLHVLLEREGVRYKMDMHNDNIIRFKTDILDFKLDYIDQYLQENNDKIKLKTVEDVAKKKFNLLGVAKHICGCAFDLSLTCLFNFP